MRLKVSLLAVAALALGGCFLFPAFKPAPGPAPYGSSYAGLDDKTVAIIIYAPTATMNEFPGAREEICSFVVTAMREHLPRTRIVAPRDVSDWQDQTFNWRSLSESDIGRHFGVDRLLCIQVLDYSTRKVLVQSEMQGRLRAQCRIYEIPDSKSEAAPSSPAEATYAPSQPAWTSLIDATWPPFKPLDPTQINEGAARLRALDSFAARLVRYFYESQQDSAIRG